MLRSLYAGVSGMRSNQTKMDVLGNNIANVNTTGYKSGRVRFQDMLSQTLSSAQSPTAGSLGGVNAQQVGLGVKIGAVDTIMTDGALQPTNRDLDLAIEGNGFFMVSQDGDDMRFYTRDGAFYRDYEGNLVNAGGYRVMGYAADNAGAVTVGEANLTTLSIPNKKDFGAGIVDLQTFAIDGSGIIKGVYSDGSSHTLGQLALSKFDNPEGLEKVGNNNYRASNNSGAPQTLVANTNGYGIVRQGVLEMSNVDLANEFTELIVTSRSYQANSRTITTSDEMLQELINLKR
ncbi:flagellar hook-basal body complex protein [Proteiniclasticum sp.]|uniref:flagellar hook-basal body complex protein n=1 Tax=Proteiniclasticum sp. TaxID=2053595 RepID=UPI00289CF90E|nr:flagellar hook-basal body complex protein [Proteiniclasticum sp.]